MDAAAADADVKLYKASAELLAELQVKIPQLLRKSNRQLRKWVYTNKTIELTRILDSFQEWPQLLDPILADLIHLLTDAFTAYCQSNSAAYLDKDASELAHIEPLPRSVCRLLYVFCKVRGQKIITRLLNNEARYIEPLLVCFQRWRRTDVQVNGISWEERYIMLLWLSHLMLAPFELATISGVAAEHTTALPKPILALQLPGVARSLLSAAFGHIYTASKDHESASLLTVRLSLRKDMQHLGLPKAIVDWCTKELSSDQEQTKVDQYRYVGLLTLLHGMTHSASGTEATPFFEHIFETCRILATETTELATTTRQSAPSRKLLIKTMRSAMLHAIALSSVEGSVVAESADMILEEGIQILLEWLADSDTPVRQAASKALGMIILKLDPGMASDVIDAVLGCLEENILLENRQTGQLVVATDLIIADVQKYKKNVNAVDPLKWHGAMLTLGHVLFRRSPPVEQLGPILEALLIGLAFEQRSNVGTSTGVAVRDAACFGIWSLARKYSTREVDQSMISSSFRVLAGDEESGVLQTVANHLVTSSCLDPSGNLRRGASAALQELIGRHPDTIRQGISVVQQVDYHAVARRSRAISEVARDVSQLDETYHICILFSLLDWRGCRAVDAESRRQAAVTIGNLFGTAGETTRSIFAQELVGQISDLKPSNVGTNAAARHGLLLALTAVLESSTRAEESVQEAIRQLFSTILNLGSLTGSLTGRVTADLTNVLEATARLIAGSADQLLITQSATNPNDFLASASQILDRCTTASEDDLLCAVSSVASVKLFALLSASEKDRFFESWLPKSLPKQKSIHTCKGRLESMSMLFLNISSSSGMIETANKIVEFLTSIVASELRIETRVNAMSGIVHLVEPKVNTHRQRMSAIQNAILIGLCDYTNDQRGDVGSTLRLSSIDAVQTLQRSNIAGVEMIKFVQVVTRLSVEKLTKVRFAAWNCLKIFWPIHISDHPMEHSFDHLADISTFPYYRQLFRLFSVLWLREQLLLGLLNATSGGTDDISCVASDAFVTFLLETPKDERENILSFVIVTILDKLALKNVQEDREVVPMLDILCLIVEQFCDETYMLLKANRSKVLQLLDDLQTSQADIPRLQALIRFLCDLVLVEDYRLDSIDKISRKLLHKWPKVRQSSADAIVFLNPESIPRDVDWNSSAAANKSEVLEIRRGLGVAGRKTAKV